MTGRTLTVVSVAEIALLVAVLAFFLLAIAKRLRSISSNLATLAAGLEIVEGHVSIITPGSAAANRVLTDVVTILGNVVRRAGTVASRTRA